MNKLREKPYKVFASGHRGARLRLPFLLREIGFVEPGDTVYFHQCGDSVVISHEGVIANTPGVASSKVFQYGSFMGVILPLAVRKLYGLEVGSEYYAYYDRKTERLVIEATEEKT